MLRDFLILTGNADFEFARISEVDARFVKIIHEGNGFTVKRTTPVTNNPIYSCDINLKIKLSNIN